MKKLSVLLSTVLLSLFASQAMAEVDVTAATTAITTDGGTAIAAVGGALIGLAGIAVVYT